MSLGDGQYFCAASELLWAFPQHFLGPHANLPCRTQHAYHKGSNTVWPEILAVRYFGGLLKICHSINSPPKFPAIRYVKLNERAQVQGHKWYVCIFRLHKTLNHTLQAGSYLCFSASCQGALNSSFNVCCCMLASLSCCFREDTSSSFCLVPLAMSSCSSAI